MCLAPIGIIYGFWAGLLKLIKKFLYLFSEKTKKVKKDLTRFLRKIAKINNCQGFALFQQAKTLILPQAAFLAVRHAGVNPEYF